MILTDFDGYCTNCKDSPIVHVEDGHGGTEAYCVKCDYVMLPEWLQERSREYGYH